MVGLVPSVTFFCSVKLPRKVKAMEISTLKRLKEGKNDSDMT